MLWVSHTVAACIEGDLKDVPLIAQVTSHIIFHAKYTRVRWIGFKLTHTLLPRTYFPYHLTYTSLMIGREIFSL